MKCFVKTYKDFPRQVLYRPRNLMRLRRIHELILVTHRNEHRVLNTGPAKSCN